MLLIIKRIALVVGLAFSGFSAARAQVGRPALASLPAAPDSVARVYTSVQYMPLYRGEPGTQKLAADLAREFRAAGTAAGCVAPTFLVVVSLTVGPSGVVQDVRSLNNLPLISQAEFDAGAKGFVGTRPDLEPLPAACEAALVAAARRLPRLTPGAMNGRRVAVSYTLKLAGATN